VNEEPSLIEMQSDRVRIRPWEQRDLLAQESWPRYKDPFSSLWNTPRPVSLNGDYVGYAASMRRIWAIEDRHKRLIGRISLREVEQHRQHSRLGISLGSPYVGQGLGTEALTLFLNHYFGPMGFLSMLLDVAGFNRRAVHCYERLGFRHVGSDWRHVGRDPALRLLDNPAYRELQPFFRRERRGAWVQFFEMELRKEEWIWRSE
jgi:RimJ/RimL family protein N-acetyltransferase